MAFSLSAPTGKIGGRVPDGPAAFSQRDGRVLPCRSLLPTCPSRLPPKNSSATPNDPAAFSQRDGEVLSRSVARMRLLVGTDRKRAQLTRSRTVPAEVLAASVAIVAGSCSAVRNARLGGKSRRHDRQLGQQGPGLLATSEADGKSNQPRAARRHAPGPEPRSRGVLYTFLSAYGRLAPSGLRRFILQSPAVVLGYAETRAKNWPSQARARRLVVFRELRDKLIEAVRTVRAKAPPPWLVAEPFAHGIGGLFHAGRCQERQVLRT